MASLAYQPLILELLARVARARDWFRERHPDARRAGEHRSGFYADAWRDAAAHLGASVELLNNDVLEIRHGSACTRVRQTITAADDPVTLAIAGNKPLAYRLLARQGLHLPRYLEFTLGDISQAVDFIAGSRMEWVVKPANGAAGRGVTTGVRSRSDLIRAAVAAAAYEPHLLVEQQIEGDVYRLLYLDGLLLDAVLRKGPTITGDGRSTIGQLVESENRARLADGAKRAQVLLSVDLDMRRTLERQGLSPSSVPTKGARLTVKTVINENSTADNLPAATLVCKSVVEEGAAAAAAVGARLAGVDIVTRDPRVSLAASGGVILEVNTTPGYHYHYHQRDGGVPVAIPVLAWLLRREAAAEQPSRNPLGARQDDCLLRAG